MDLQCPYCNTGLDVCHDDGFGYEESTKHKMDCHNCNQSFVFQTEISFYYEPTRADCLNDGKHIWEPTHTYPTEFTKMECSCCGERRKCTESEMQTIINLIS